jgi:hypothetical protein
MEKLYELNLALFADVIPKVGSMLNLTICANL